MTTYEFKQVRALADDLNVRLDRCGSEEGTHSATVEAQLDLCAECCCKLSEAARQWRRDVFSGHVAFDPTTEQWWKAELARLLSRALVILDGGRRAESPCYVLDEQRNLEAAIWNLHRLTSEWSAPKLAVGPSARQKLGDDVVAEARRRMASLPSLPLDWQPFDNRQRMLLHAHKAQRSSQAHD